MDRRVWAVFAVLTVAWPVSALAEMSCPRPPGLAEPVLDFQVVEPRVVLRHDVDLRGLPRIDGHVEQLPSNWTVQGLTMLNDRLDIQASWKEQRFSDGHVCLWPQAIKVMLGSAEEKVYVAADYPEGSCEYNAILGHEKRHVAINGESLRAHAGQIRQALMEGIRASTPLPLSQPTADKSLLSRRLSSFAGPAVSQLRTDLMARNHEIDTPDAYRAEQARSGCRNWKGR